MVYYRIIVLGAPIYDENLHLYNLSIYSAASNKLFKGEKVIAPLFKFKMT